MLSDKSILWYESKYRLIFWIIIFQWGFNLCLNDFRSTLRQIQTCNKTAVCNTVKKKARTCKCNHTCLNKSAPLSLSLRYRRTHNKMAVNKHTCTLSNTPSPVPESRRRREVGRPCAAQQPWQTAGNLWGSHVSLWRSIHDLATILSLSPFCWSWRGWQEWGTYKGLTLEAQEGI